eukprot:CAMPEP_0113319852 /NCGR_PEP_ID=MMETSP0010_2-20120614/13887_1 /TAXON_ID=216773 ORGANISM="Corethron hystrix, Strain 308" /NCGR_SAMPLE_ID=MMETSP0010_2 /ASSEMBLY_ACC=CAM_ASM_000155 /LENGTH=52 /DNA_ID=CAMNT_0000177501 /DNA_START=392 /DNA_END=550 /DNA_ORIENTATION=+ /assembly_acc=CAM_ASM_000155
MPHVDVSRVHDQISNKRDNNSCRLEDTNRAEGKDALDMSVGFVKKVIPPEFL